MTKHRWSGWPGAWCLDCGTEDISELCLAPAEGHEGHARFVDFNLGFLGVCENGECPEPGSKRHDPYARPPRG